ncbi:hypothetical protein J6590_008511 [Homalodisca vitripennis]|nr:hypothetical protein J6590_008511 [Homalodisca vitripennis]
MDLCRASQPPIYSLDRANTLCTLRPLIAQEHLAKQSTDCEPCSTRTASLLSIITSTSTSVLLSVSEYDHSGFILAGLGSHLLAHGTVQLLYLAYSCHSLRVEEDVDKENTVCGLCIAHIDSSLRALPLQYIIGSVCHAGFASHLLAH